MACPCDGGRGPTPQPITHRFMSLRMYKRSLHSAMYHLNPFDVEAALRRPLAR